MCEVTLTVLCLVNTWCLVAQHFQSLSCVYSKRTLKTVTKNCYIWNCRICFAHYLIVEWSVSVLILTYKLWIIFSSSQSSWEREVVVSSLSTWNPTRVKSPQINFESTSKYKSCPSFSLETNCLLINVLLAAQE